MHGCEYTECYQYFACSIYQSTGTYKENNSFAVAYVKRESRCCGFVVVNVGILLYYMTPKTNNAEAKSDLT